MTHVAFVFVAFLAVNSPVAEPLAHPLAHPAEAPRPGLVKRKLRAFLEDDPGRGRGVRLGPLKPGVEIVSSGGGPAGVLHFWTPDIGDSGFDIHAAASYSIYRYQHYDVRAGLVAHDQDRIPREERGTSALFPLSDLEKTASVSGFNVYAAAQYRDYPREVFYGTGPDSMASNRTDYRRKDALYEGVVRFSVSRLSVMGRAGLLQTSIRPGRDSAFPNTDTSGTEETAAGLVRSPDFVHVSAGAWLERRDEPLNPHRGLSVGVAVSRFDDRGASAFQFNRVLIDARQYLPLGGSRNVIALRQAAALDSPDDGSRVPFYLQSMLGGSHFLRGYPTARFRDDKMLALAAEYRFELTRKVEIAMILDAGKVFPTLRSFNLRRVARSYGVGIRLKSPRRVRLRLDVLHGSEGTKVHLKLGPSF